MEENFTAERRKYHFREEEREGKQKENCKDELKQKFIARAEEGEKEKKMQCKVTPIFSPCHKKGHTARNSHKLQ